MMYVVRNLHDGGGSVGTRPLDLGAAADSAATRTGRPISEIVESIEQLSGLVPAVSIPAAEGGETPRCAVRIEVVL